MNILISFFVGLMFAFGLGVSGMTQPHKVIGFLNVFGDWDPTLLAVMFGAVVVHFLAYRLVKRFPQPWASKEWHIPTKRELTPQLIYGSIVFGMGWGMAGFCPGPALTTAAAGSTQAIIFVFSMLVGMWLYRKLERKLFPSK